MTENNSDDSWTDFTSSDAITDAERSFPFPDLLRTDYFQKYRHAYYKLREVGGRVGARNYSNLLTFLAEINEYRADDAGSFAKVLRRAGNDWRNCEATFAEIIVYRYYVRLVAEGLIASVRSGRAECDVIVSRLDGSVAFLEVFCVMPEFPAGTVVRNYNTHRQEAAGSIRQKLLRKVDDQKQMRKLRENFAVIELNDVSIVGDFVVLSSLSNGYKVQIDMDTKRAVARGFDWRGSVFDNVATRNLKGVIWFDLGEYESRRILLNPRFVAEDAIRRRAHELFIARGGQHGRDVEDWLTAEQELWSAGKSPHQER